MSQGYLKTAVGLLFIFGLAACAQKKSGRYDSQDFFDAFRGKSSYFRIYDQYTRNDTAQSDFDMVMRADVTLWSQELRAAYVEENVRKYRLTPEEETALTTEQMSEDEVYYVFLIAAVTRQYTHNDLSQKDSIWRMMLSDEDNKIYVRPERVEHLNRRDERAKYFYPTMNRFGEMYRAYFPKSKFKNSKMVALEITGPRGAMEFPFEVTNPNPAREIIQPQ